VAVGAVVLALAAAPVSFADPLRSVPVRGQLYAVGCMTRSLCVADGIGRGQGWPTVWVVLRGGKVIRAFQPGAATGTSPGGTSVSCPDSSGCVGVAGLEDGAMILTFDRAGVARRRTVRSQRGTSFGSISCARLDRCELAGWDVHGDVAIASWDGSRLGHVRRVPIPNGSGSGDASPQISCALSWCEVAMNPTLPSGFNRNTEQGFLITTHDGRLLGAHWIRGYQFDSVSCTTASHCYIALTNVPPGIPGNQRYKSYLALLTGGVVGSLKPTALIDPGIACRGSVCVAAAGNQIATYLSGVQRSLVSVQGAQAYRGVQLGPGMFFAAIGASNAESILTAGVYPTNFSSRARRASPRGVHSAVARRPDSASANWRRAVAASCS
jgi:hypothetical protein